MTYTRLTEVQEGKKCVRRLKKLGLNHLLRSSFGVSQASPFQRIAAVPRPAGSFTGSSTSGWASKVASSGGRYVAKALRFWLSRRASTFTESSWKGKRMIFMGPNWRGQFSYLSNLWLPASTWGVSRNVGTLADADAPLPRFPTPNSCPGKPPPALRSTAP